MTRRQLLGGACGLGVAGLLQAQPPGLTPIDEAGLTRILGARNGRPLLLDFWASWCVPCQEEMPQLIALHAKRKDIDFLTVSCDEPESEKAALSFVQKHRPPAPWYVRHVKDDDRFINSVDPKWSGALPGLFLYDGKGKLARSFVGETEMKELEAAIAALASRPRS